jgi:hypothetical protein
VNVAGRAIDLKTTTAGHLHPQKTPQKRKENSMTKSSSFKNLTLALGFAAFCSNAPLRAGDQVPFKGTFDPIVVSTTPVDATHELLVFDVHILATCLGKARGTASAILDLTTLLYVGEGTWAAPNGDAIAITFTGQFVPTDTPGLFDNVETCQIVGGTGRFGGATGAFVAGGQFNALTQSAPAPVPFKGTISSPGSLKK